MYACKDRKPYEQSIKVQDGWLNSWARNMVDMEFRMSLPCQYRDTDLGKADAGCTGCKWRKTDDAARAPEAPAVVDAVEAREWFSYIPETGELFWKKSPARSIQVGTKAGCKKPIGYVFVKWKGRDYRAHRLAWLITHGAWPADVIDHINGDKADNRLSNLRSVSQRMNTENQRRARRDSQLSVLGVVVQGNRFLAYVKSKGATHYLGSYDTAEMAHAAYLEGKRKIHEGCTL